MTGPVPIPLSRPTLGAQEEAACLRVLRSGVLVQGPEGEALEHEFAARVGAVHAVSVSSGTAALQLALMALGVGPGDEVIVPAYTFIATANAVALTGAQVILADVDPDSLNLDPASAAEVMGPRTRAVVPVHQYGLPADLDAIRTAVPGLTLIEDAACAVGAHTPSGPVGSGPGQGVCFSFHPRKVITTGEGGMVTCADADLAARLRALRQHGQGEDGTREPGYNFRLSELAAAVGRVQLTRLDELLRRRREVASWYRAGLGELAWLQLPATEARGHIYQSFVVRLRPGAPIGRAALVQALTAQGIGCQAGVRPIHQHAPYRDAARIRLPVSELAGESALFLPMHPGLDEEQVARVCRAVRSVAGA